MIITFYANFQDDQDDSLIVIFIAETDPDYVYQISAEVQKQFQKYLGWQHNSIDGPATTILLSSVHCRYWLDRNHLPTCRVLSRHDIIEADAWRRHGASDLEIQAGLGLQLPDDVCQVPGPVLCPAGGRCAHQERIHVHHETLCPGKDCREEALVCD